MEKTNGIIIEGKVYEVESYPFTHCDKCELKKECDQVSRDYCLVDKLFGCNGMRIFRYSQPLTDKINEK